MSPTRRRSPTSGSSFTDKMRDRLTMLSTAIQEADSGVKERRAKKSVRTGRKGGIWNSVADLLGNTTPRPRNGPEELPMSRNRGSSFGMTLRRASSADSFSASPRAAQPDCTPSHSVMAQLACLGIKEAQPIKTCRSRSSPASRSPPVIGAQLPRNDICGNEAAPINAGARLLRPTPSRLRSPSPGAPAAATTVATVAPGGHSPGMGPFLHHGESRDFDSQLAEVKDDYTPDSVLASFSSGSGSSGGFGIGWGGGQMTNVNTTYRN